MESGGVNAGDAVGNGDARQAGARMESVGTNAGHATGDGNAPQVIA